METGKIYSAINTVMAEVGAVAKKSVNKDQGFAYRGIDAVMNALQPAMVKAKVFVVPEIIDEVREERTTSRGNAMHCARLKIKYTFYAEDGSNVQALVIGEAMDTADKVTNKAMSIAFKYACFQVFCIPTEEMKEADPDAVTPEETKPLVVDEMKIKVLKDKMAQKGVTEEAILKRYATDKLENMTVKNFMKAMAALEKTKDAEKKPDVTNELGL